MAKTRIMFETVPPGLEDDLSDVLSRSRRLHDVWERRREIDWTIVCEQLPKRSVTHPTKHKIVLATVNAGERVDGTRVEIMRMTIDVETVDGENALEKGKRVLDLPITASPRPREPRGDGLMGRRNIHPVKGDSVIGPMPMRWPVGRRITGYSSHLGSYGQGGIGLSGWQLNGGSWMVLPISNSDSWITLTMEEVEASPDRTRLDILVDQRIIGVHPGQKAAFPPWEHRYAGHETIEDMPDFSIERPVVTRFNATRDGFVLEAGSQRNWRFEIADHLPRPRWGGTGAERNHVEGDSIVDAFILAHDCYLGV